MQRWSDKYLQLSSDKTELLIIASNSAIPEIKHCTSAFAPEKYI